MAEYDLNSKTVIELRKIAKELHVPLSAGISKQGIIEKLSQAIASSEAAQAPEAPAAAPEQPSAGSAPEQEAPAAPAETPAPAPEAAQPQFKQAYQAPRFNSKPAYQAPAYGRPAAQHSPAPSDAARTSATRATSFHSRFGPAASADLPHEEERPMRSEAPRGNFNQNRNNYGDGGRFQSRGFEQRQPAYEQRQPAYEQRQPAYEQRQPAYEQRQPAYEQRQPAYEQRQNTYEQRSSYQPRQNYGHEAAPFTVNPTASEISQAVDYPETTGVLEILPEGYGFLRNENMVASARDIYVSAAQVRRFSLRTGDLICGKVRPQRDGDKYPALLVVSQVNGQSPEAAATRPSFDSMTPIYPTRRIQLECTDAPQSADLRLMDLITPIGFGQRGLIQCGPGTGKTRLLTRLANAITQNHPEAEVILLLFNETPENVTLVREAVQCHVVASTFDMAPESHLRMADLVSERAQRLAEMKQDVIILVDSLTTLIRTISTAAMQAGRAVPGMISPQSLQKAKRLFGAARCLREGGSLTVIATMNTDSGVKADDSVVGDFRGAANMELVLDTNLARAGVYPPYDLARCGTRRAEAILSPAHIEGLKLLHEMLGHLPAENAVKELTSMLEKAATNEDLLARIKVWAESMKG